MPRTARIALYALGLILVWQVTGTLLATAWGAPAPSVAYHGALIVLHGEIPDRSALLQEVDAFPRGRTVGLGYRRALGHPELEWYGFDMVTDSVVTWGMGDSLALTVNDSLLTAVDAFVMSPPFEQRPRPLVGELRPQDLWRARVRGGIATVIFAGFPRRYGLGSNSGVRLGVVVKARSRPHQGARGGRQ